MPADRARPSDRPTPRELRVATVLAALLALSMAAIAVAGHDASNDFDRSALTSLEHLRRLEIAAFLDASSIDVGSYILRAPLAFVPSLWGGTADSLFAVMALPGAVALVALAVALWYRARLGSSHAVAVAVLLLVAANPFALNALVPGHAEEIVGAVLCVAAVVAAGRGRPLLAAVIVGVAVANKAWAVVAVPPVLLMLRERRLLAAAVMAAIPAVVYAPLVMRGTAGVDGALMATQTAEMFKPWQVWWFFADPDHLHAEAFEDVTHVYRDAPGWVVHLNHPLAVLVPAGICLALGRRMRQRPWQDMLLLLALMLLLRCMLDAANNAYYHLPFVFALLSWEVLRRPGLPKLTLAVTLIGWPMLALLPYSISPDAQAALYLGTSIPFAIGLAALLLRRPRTTHRHAAAAPRGPVPGFYATAGEPSGRS